MQKLFILMLGLLAAAPSQARMGGDSSGGIPNPGGHLPLTGLQGGITLFPGGVANDPATVGYFLHPSGGLQAIDLLKGKVLWVSQKATWPLRATSGEVLAASRTVGAERGVGLVSLNPESGELVEQYSQLGLPDWVGKPLSYDSSQGFHFELSAELGEESTAKVSWQASGWYSGGAMPPPDVERRARKHAEGSVQLWLNEAAPQGQAPLPIPIEDPTQEEKLCGKLPQGTHLLYTVAIGALALCEYSVPQGSQWDRQIRLRGVPAAGGQVIWDRPLAPQRIEPPRP